MLLLILFRYIFGFADFSASGGFPERFVNLCAANRVNLWNLQYRAGTLYASTDRNSYKRIRRPAAKSGMKVRVIRRHGLPFFMSKHKRRVGVLVGMAVFAAAVTVLSTRIWSINVQGNVNVNDDVIIGVFEELGVKSGVRGKSIDLDAVEKAALDRIGELSWVGLNLNGSAAIIEVRERVEKPSIDNGNTPSNIISSADGQVVIMRVFGGTAAQKVGSAVMKGDLLISGTKEQKDGTTAICRADGYVVARTAHTVASSVTSKGAFELKKREYTRYSLGFLLFDIPLGALTCPKGLTVTADKAGIRIADTVLPVSITRHYYYSRADMTLALTKEQTRLAAENDFFDSYTDSLRAFSVEKQTITVSEIPGRAQVQGEFTCLENIGREQQLSLEITQ